MSGIFSANDCDPDFIFQPDIPTKVGLSDGQITIDSLFFQWFRTEKFNVAVGRMETKFVARGGVYAKYALSDHFAIDFGVNYLDADVTIDSSDRRSDVQYGFSGFAAALNYRF